MAASTLLLLFSTAWAGRGPDPISASPEAVAACPVDAVEAWRAPLRHHLRRASREEAGRRFDLAVVEWAACAWLHTTQVHRLPEIHDPRARLVLAGFSAAPGSPERLEAVAVEDPDLVGPVAVLALAELSELVMVQAVDPADRPLVVAAVVGGHACPLSRDWMTGPQGELVAWCPDKPDQAELGRRAARWLALRGRWQEDPWLSEVARPQLEALQVRAGLGLAVAEGGDGA